MIPTRPLLARDGSVLPYRVTVSPRARRVSIRISPRDGVRVTVPRRHDPREVERFVHSRREWIAKHLGRFEEIRQVQTPEALTLRPDSLTLVALGEDWRVAYRETRAKGIRVAIPEPGWLEAAGDIGDVQACQLALRRWAGRHAAQTLIPWLHELSRELALPFAEARIRGQRARWGSCSAQRVIHLNYKLLFLPRAAARYVLVHELCHTREMNHSPRFKDLVHRHAPDWRAAHAVIREAWKYVPAWVDGGYLAGSDF